MCRGVNNVSEIFPVFSLKLDLFTLYNNKIFGKKIRKWTIMGKSEKKIFPDFLGNLDIY